MSELRGYHRTPESDHSMDEPVPYQNGMSVGEALVAYLEARGVEVVFGIPGVHTVEMYRGLSRSKLRHVTPRHEQGAGFMADGYARASGKPGVAFVITGPGMTNILTAMGQALADSIPMLVVSSVNERSSLGKGLGELHELPDQHALCETVAVQSHHVTSADALYPALDLIFEKLSNMRPGPHHIQLPMDVFGASFSGNRQSSVPGETVSPDTGQLADAQDRLARSKCPVLVIGGGSLMAADDILALAEKLNAPVVQTINARGQMHNHPLRVPASPSLESVQALLAEADIVLAIGTQLGPTDFDMFKTGISLACERMIRVDLSAEQLNRHPSELKLCGKAEEVVPRLLDGLKSSSSQAGWGAEKASAVRTAARAELSLEYEHMLTMVETIRDSLPGSIIVGDSTQPIYAANLYYGHDNLRGWFNSSVGFGTLGYAIPAAIGAALAAPEQPVICITGDGGAQFTLPELMTAVDEELPVIFLIWNNFGYQEITNAMGAADVSIVGCDPTPPNFEGIAAANYMPFVKCENTPEALGKALHAHPDRKGPMMIEIQL